LDRYVVVAELDKSCGGTSELLLYHSMGDKIVSALATFGRTQLAYCFGTCGNIEVWDTSESEIYSTDLQDEKRGKIVAMIVSNKQHHLVDDEEFVVIVGTKSGQIECWHPELDCRFDDRSGLYQTIQAHNKEITTLCELSNGRIVSVSISQPDNETDHSLLCLWDLSMYPKVVQEEGSPLQTPVVSFLGHTHGVTSVVELKPNETIASSGVDLTIRVWRVRDGTCLTMWNSHTDTRIQLLKLKDNSLASGALDKNINRWWLREEGDRIEAELLSTFECSHPVYILEEVEPGLIVAGTSESGEIWKVSFKLIFSSYSYSFSRLLTLPL